MLRISFEQAEICHFRDLAIPQQGGSGRAVAAKLRSCAYAFAQPHRAASTNTNSDKAGKAKPCTATGTPHRRRRDPQLLPPSAGRLWYDGKRVKVYRHFAFKFEPGPPFAITAISDELPLRFNQTYKVCAMQGCVCVCACVCVCVCGVCVGG